MTAKELLAKQLDDVSYQLNKAIEGIGDAELDFKVAPTAMSIREIVAHLCEVYHALEIEAAGGTHEWGTFRIEDTSWANLTVEFETRRGRAIGIVLEGDEDAKLISGAGYIVAHDCYHIGQIATIRLATDTSWNPYSLYPH